MQTHKSGNSNGSRRVFVVVSPAVRVLKEVIEWRGLLFPKSGGKKRVALVVA